MSKATKSCTLNVSGTHCKACEILIEKELRSLPGVKSVSASSTSGTVQIDYLNGHHPAISHLNKLFKDSGYVFSATAPERQSAKAPSFFNSFLVVSIVVVVFYFLQQSGVFSLVNVGPDSLPLAFFPFGLLAGFSTCAALVGGIVLSLSRQWSHTSSSHPLTPHLMFNFGRVASFALLGGLLGVLGQSLRLSLTAGAVLTVLVSLLMIVLALQMLGVKALANFQLALPKSITGRLADESRFQGTFMPALMGAFTFFLPCGFTLTAQSLALATGSFTSGALILGFFALGTAIPLMLIGLGGSRLTSRPAVSQIAGLLVLAFALYNINGQLTVLGLKPSLPSSPSVVAQDNSDLPPIVDGKQVVKMDASSTGYVPSRLKIRSGVPVRWEITDRGTSGCTNAVIARDFVDGPINLVPGTTSVREFTPTRPGTYRFSCWMGMVSGTFEVI
jgi:sulfite exporter TauE/SafE/copper chaperone CopZ/plastocyanin